MSRTDIKDTFLAKKLEECVHCNSPVAAAVATRGAAIDVPDLAL